MPRHWIEKHPNPRAQASFDARAWAVGQAVTAQAALELLEHRAGAAEQPWPEFTEYDCFACHHDLGQPSWRQQRGYGDRLPGSLPWGVWPMAMPKTLATLPPFEDSNVAAALKQVEQLMGQPRPDRRQVASQARQAAGVLRQWLGRVDKASYDRDTIGKLLHALIEDKQQLTAEGWDGAAQTYLAVVALNQAYQSEPIRQAAHALSGVLAFPPGQDSPKGYQPKGFQEELRKLRKQLPE
jgi:hypothetical protein